MYPKRQYSKAGANELQNQPLVPKGEPKRYIRLEGSGIERDIGTGSELKVLKLRGQ